MPQLTWTITADDDQILRSLTGIAQAADRAAQAVQGVGRSSPRTSPNGGGTTLNAANVAAVQTAYVRLNTQIDALQRNLQRLGQKNWTVQFRSNYRELQADLADLQTRLQTVGNKPITITARGDLGAIRTQLALAQQDYAKVTQTVEGFGNAHERAARQTATLLSRIQGIATGLIIYRAFAAGEAAITHAVAASLQLAAGLEQARQGFVAFNGSVQAANQELAALQRFSIATPLFDTQNTRQYALQLQGVGESARRVIPDLRDLGAVVIGGGGGAPQIQEAVLAYQQVIALGKLQGQEARQFANALVPVWNIVSEGLNVSIAQARQLSEQGQITADVFQQAFSLYAARHFADTLQQASQTFNGLASQARESWQAALTEFGTGLAQGILPTLRDVATTLQDPRTLAAIRQWGVDAGQFVGQLWQAAKIVAQWAGLDLPEFPSAPDYSGTVTDTDALARNLAGISAQAQTLVTLQESYTADIRGAQAQIEQMQAAQVIKDRQASDAIAAQRDAQTAQDRTYDTEIGRLRTIGTQLERNHEIARQEREEAGLTTDIAKDELLARNVASAQGQAAAKRLKDERERLANLRADQQYNTARNTNQDAIAAQEALRKGYDQQVVDAIAAAERTREAQSRQSADAIKGLQGQIDTWKQVLAAIKAPIPVVDEFGNAMDATFDQIQITAGQTTTAAVTAATNEYRQFYDHTLPDLATQGRPLILTALFGTGQEQQDAGKHLAENFITGLGNALQNNSNDTLKWFGDLLRGDWQAAAQDYPLIKTVGDTARNIGDAVGTGTQQKGATPGGPPHLADPNRPGWVDVGPTPGNWRYDPAEWERLTGKRMPTVNSAPGGSGADFGPGVYGPGYNGPYSGGRAGGGPVWPGGIYTVGENGPETLRMGTRGGYVVPTYAQAAPAGGNTQLTITVRTERGEVLGIVQTAIAQQVTGKFMATRMGAYASR